MNAYSQFSTSKAGLVADVGRTTVRVGLTDEAGRLRHDSVREYDPKAQPTISTAITAFASESGLRRLPQRAAIAVTGVPRGETISITKSRWILSRGGLTAMFQAPPLILNDFAANAWAMSDTACSGRTEPLTSATVRAHQPGTYCIIGIGSGLGVAMMSRDEHGLVTVVPTEGGHLGLMDGLPGAAAIFDRIRGANGAVTAESILSGPGLLSIYRAVCASQGRQPLASDLRELLAQLSFRNDPAAAETFDFFGRAFWHFAGNMVLAYGAWDGLMVTGSITAALKSLLRRPDLARHFLVHGVWTKALASVPRATISFRYAELEGAAVALLMEEHRRSMGLQCSSLAEAV